jgi:hypothetical protein
MNSVFISWRSTISGIIVIVTSILWMMNGGDKGMGSAMIAAGLGLVAAKDSNVSGIPSVHVPEQEAAPDGKPDA